MFTLRISGRDQSFETWEKGSFVTEHLDNGFAIVKDILYKMAESNLFQDEVEIQTATPDGLCFTFKLDCKSNQPKWTRLNGIDSGYQNRTMKLSKKEAGEGFVFGTCLNEAGEGYEVSLNFIEKIDCFDDLPASFKKLI